MSNINEAVAEKVMSWELKEGHHNKLCWFDKEGKLASRPSCFFPTLNIGHAFVVIEKLKEDFTIEIRYSKAGRAECTLQKESPHNEHHLTGTCSAEAETIPMAICLAALKAYGIEVVIPLENYKELNIREYKIK